MKRSSFLKALGLMIAAPVAIGKAIEGSVYPNLDSDKVILTTPEGNRWFSFEEHRAAEIWQESFDKVRYTNNPHIFKEPYLITGPQPYLSVKYRDTSKWKPSITYLSDKTAIIHNTPRD
jgi:hypothetical protein